MKIEIYLEQLPHQGQVNMYVYGKNHTGEKFIALPTELIFQKTEYQELMKPTLQFSGFESREFLQALSDALTRIGYKPSEMDSVNGELGATKKHLEDMRTIAFDSIGKMKKDIK